MEDKCIVCGRPIPEGRQVCHFCEKEQPKGCFFDWRDENDDFSNRSDTPYVSGGCVLGSRYKR